MFFFISVGLTSANVVVLLDVSQKENMDVLVRFVTNVLRLFKLDDTEATLLAFGKDVKTVFQGQKFKDENEIKKEMEKVYWLCSSTKSAEKLLE